MSEEELKQWLRTNLVIETEYSEQYPSINDIKVSLRFDDEEKPFTYDYVAIP